VSLPPRIGDALAKTVLIADDSEILRKRMCKFFETEEDYDLCAEARNGEEAITLALQHRPDLIVLDLSMPVMNGLDAARELKRLMPQVPIILFTAHAHLMPYVGVSHADLVLAKDDLNVLMRHIRELAPV
jgi:DNA-binding NarL/FixJ family response regulator